MEIINSFSFQGGVLFEIKFTNVPVTAPKNERFQWCLSQGEKLVLLNFQKMDGEIRYFDGDTTADLKKMIFYHENYMFDLFLCTQEQLVHIKTTLLPKLFVMKYA